MYMEDINNDSSNCELSTSPKNDYIDEITLQLLINKQCKTKYLMQNDEQKHKELEETKSQIYKYKSEIQNIFQCYLNDHSYQICNDIDNCYHNFVKACLKHFEIKEIEQENNYNKPYEDDMLFGNNSNAFTKSYWGKSIKKI